MVKTHPLFRRRLVKVDAHVKVAAEQLIHAHAESLRPDYVGKIFQPLFHNYLYGITRQDVVEQITHMVKREGRDLVSIWRNQKWINPKNRDDAQTLSVMGMEVDQWVVKFAEILMVDIKENYEAQNTGLLVSTPLELFLFYWVFGNDWKLLGKVLLAGIAVSEGSMFYKDNKGFSMVEFLLFGVILQHLYNTRKLFTLPALAVAAASLWPLYNDPPAPGQWKTWEGKEHTAHDLHYLAMASGVLLRWFHVV